MAFWKLAHEQGPSVGVWRADSGEEAIAQLLAKSAPIDKFEDPAGWHAIPTRKWEVWNPLEWGFDRPRTVVYADTEKRALDRFAWVEGYDDYGQWLEDGGADIHLQEVKE